MPSAEASGAICVQGLDDSRSSAIRITYRISLRSSSIQEPRYPSSGVVLTVIATWRGGFLVAEARATGPAAPRPAPHRAFSSDGSAARRTHGGVAPATCAALGVAERGGGWVVRTTDVWGAPPTHERRAQVRRGVDFAVGRGPRPAFGAHCVSMILPQVHLRNGERLCGRGE